MKNLVKLNDKRIFFCGIGGIGMSAIAGFLFDNKIHNLEILGSNITTNSNVVKLQNKGIKIFIGHNENNILSNNLDIFVYTDVISDDNIEIITARKLNLTILSRGEFLAKISSSFKKNINISGAHGKTTTTGMIGQMFDFANKSPSIICGGLIKNYKSNYKTGNSDFFVKEADESTDSFLKLITDTAVITNIGEDHLEIHNNIQNIYRKFHIFCQNANNIVITNEYKYEYCRKIIEDFKDSKNIISFGLNKNSDVYAENIRYNKNYIKFDVFYKKKLFLKSVKILMFGEHNILNSLATICTGIIYDINKVLIKRSLLNFKGISDRFDILKRKYNNLIINDYAHNPIKIRSAISSAIHLREQNEKYKNYKIIVFFEPHKHSRIRTQMTDFSESFKFIDKLYILDIYQSFEKNQETISKQLLEDKIKIASQIDTCLIDTDKKKIKNEISKISNNIILFLSAGNYHLASEI